MYKNTKTVAIFCNMPIQPKVPVIVFFNLLMNNCVNKHIKIGTDKLFKKYLLFLIKL